MQTVEAVYENGVFRPLGPIDLAERELVTLNVSAPQVSPKLPADLLEQFAKFSGPVPTLAEVRRITSKIPQSFAEMISEERDEH